MVGASSGAISDSISWRWSSTWSRRVGSSTGIVTVVSEDSASLASTQSRRSWAMATRVAGSVGSIPLASMPITRSTWPITAASMSTPPSRSMPSGWPRTANVPSRPISSTTVSNVPPPRS